MGAGPQDPAPFLWNSWNENGLFACIFHLPDRLIWRSQSSVDLNEVA